MFSSLVWTDWSWLTYNKFQSRKCWMMWQEFPLIIRCTWRGSRLGTLVPKVFLDFSLRETAAREPRRGEHESRKEEKSRKTSGTRVGWVEGRGWKMSTWVGSWRSTLWTSLLPLILKQECNTPSLRLSSSLNTQNLTCIKFCFLTDERKLISKSIECRDRVTRCVEIMLSISHIESCFCCFLKLAEPIRYLLAYTETKCEYCDYVTGDGKSFLWTKPVVLSQKEPLLTCYCDLAIEQRHINT